MNIKALTLIIFSLTSTNILAANHMMIIGGGGEPACVEGATSGKNARPNCEKTIFDAPMQNLGANLKNGNWNYQVAYNGGHAQSEQILRTDFPNPTKTNSAFTPDRYNQMIADYTAKILAGEIKSGDQLVIIINTHGAEETPDSKTHLIAASGDAMTNFNTGKGSTLVNLDDLAGLTKLASDMGINMGVVDLSCHSGKTMSLKKLAPNACIVTSTGPKHYGFSGPSTFGASLLKNFKAGETLESAFLKARINDRDPAYPMISTDENEQIVAEIYSKITPYLYYYDPEADKLTKFMNENSSDMIMCKREHDFKKLFSSINQLQAAANGKKTGFNGEELKRLLTSYKATQDQILQEANRLGAGLTTKKEIIVKKIGPYKTNVKNPPTEFKLELSWETILSSKPDEIIANISKMLNQTKDPYEKASTLAAIEAWKEVKIKKQQMVSTYPEILTAKATIESMTKQIGNNFDTAAKIAIQEKKFYDELYKEKQSLNFNDPCRKITF